MAEERVRRRLAAILVADLVGYSRLIEADEEGTRTRIRSLHAEVIDPRIAADGGRIVKTSGDGILVEFPSAVDAVRNALALQTTMLGRNGALPEDRRIMFRVGINVGDVIVEGDDIHGDGVNVAARLEGLCGPGEVYVSGAVYDQAAGKLLASFEDLGEQTVKNIAKPVRVYRALAKSDEAKITADMDAPLSLPDKPSIAVLPFENMSGDPEQEYFSDGITEDIITELSRFRSLHVIARNSSFRFRGDNIDITEVGRTLGVRYVVEGSVRKAANRIRVTAQLIEVSGTRHLWAERYDRDLEDIFAVQDELTRAIVSILPGRLEDAGQDHAARKPTNNMTAYDCMLLGNDRLRVHSPEMIAEARDWYQKAIDLDSRYARAHAGLAWTHICDASQGSWNDRSVDLGLKSAETALDLDGEDSWIHGVLGQGLVMRRKDREAESHFRRGLELNPNDSEVVAMFAPTLVYFGRWREGLEMINAAKRLNPYPGQWYYWYRGFALFAAHDYDGAVAALKEMRPIHYRAHAYLAASYGHLNQLDDARTELSLFIDGRDERLRKLGVEEPGSITDLAVEWADRYRDPLDKEHFLEALRKSGLPE